MSANSYSYSGLTAERIEEFRREHHVPGPEADPPWIEEENRALDSICNAALLLLRGPVGEVEQRRIAACVHACSGFQTDWLEQNEFWPFALLTSDEYAELVIAKRRLAEIESEPSATTGSDK